MFHPRALFRTLVPLLALVLLLGGCIMSPRDEDPTPVPTEPTVVDEATPEPETQTVTVTANANVRSGPDTGYAVSFWLTEGTVVTVTDHNTAGDWLQIEHGAQAGWIFAALTDAAMDVQESMPEDREPEPMKDRVVTTVPEPTVEPTAEPTEEAMPESTTETPSTVTVTGTVVNLRTGPGTDHPTDGQVHAGDQLQVTGRNQDGSWLQIMHPTTTGEHVWIYGSLTGIDGATVQTLAVVAMVEATPTTVPEPQATLEPPPAPAPAPAPPTATPTPSRTRSGAYDNPTEHADGRYELQRAGSRVAATIATTQSPVQYWAREVAAPLFTVPEGFRPPYPILRTAEGTPVLADGAPDPDHREPRRFLLRVDPDGAVHYVDDADVEGAGYLAYSLDTVWGTTPAANDRAVLEILDRHWFRKTLLSAEPPPVQFKVPAYTKVFTEMPAASLGAFVTFDADGRVTALGAPTRRTIGPKYHFHGPLLPELGQLHRLEHLDLGYRDYEFKPSGPSRRQTGASYVSRSLSIPADTGALAGTIPPQLWQLSRLRYLDLQGQLLTEPLPPEMGGLSALEHLDLGSNWLAGPLPAELGQLVRLRTLNLSVNRLTALPSELGQLTALQVLDLSGNQLTGLPPELGQLANLQILNLGPQPWGVAVFVSLGGLGLYGNRLTGLPSELGRLANLQALDLSGNRLTGLPPELGRLANLQALDLSGNGMTGLPPELGRLANLQALDLSGNRLTGLPSMLGQLTHLDNLDLSHNQLAGSLPSIWGPLIHLRTLNLSHNQLTGPLPPEWGQLANLEQLYLYNNRLTGPLPPEWGQLANLEQLYLYNNQLAGPLPPEWGQLANLEQLYLSNNQLAGPLPPEWGQLANLEQLYLSDNQLTGPVPLEWSRLTSLTYLGLSGNQLTGCYPQIYFPHLPSDLPFGGGAGYIPPPHIQTDLLDCPPPDYIYHDSRGKG